MSTTLQQGVLRESPGAHDDRVRTLGVTREAVRDLLSKSAAFRALDPDAQREIARNTVAVASYLAEPSGGAVDDTNLARDLATSTSNDDAAPRFEAQAGREGAAVAGALLREVNFPTFVSQLVTGVFHSIVQSSIEQMEAYGRLVADVAKSLNQFRDENVSVNQGRDHLVEQFPDLFEVNVDSGSDWFGESSGGPRVQLRDGVDEDAAVQQVNASGIAGSGVKDLSPETIEQNLVPAARTQLATSRQQLLATMVMMGINRIVVTDGKIQAKVLYTFQARDNMRYRRSATSFDYGDQYTSTSEGTSQSQYEGGEYARSKGADGSESENRGSAKYYSQGTYKNTSTPVVSLVSATQSEGDASIETKASLAGTVDINFKSDYFPLEKMADSFQIARIQNAANPATAANPPQPPASGAPASPGSPQNAASAPAPAPAPGPAR